MHVIRNAARGDQDYFVLPCDAAGVLKKPLLERGRDHWTPKFGAEDAVHQLANIRVGHAVSVVPPGLVVVCGLPSDESLGY